jgi:peroxiredoxin family protein
LANTYGLSYDDGKALTFKYLYGGITNEIKDNPFFSKVDKYVQKLWNTWKGNKIIKSDIYNREISRKNLSDMNPNKLFNYMIQLMETENNMAVLEQLLPTIEDNRSKLVLYNYDAFLFDFDISEGLDYLNNVKKILEQDGKYPTRVSMGSNYHEMKDITEKFK